VCEIESWTRFQKFEAVAPWILGEESTRAGKGIVIDDLHRVRNQCLAERNKIPHGKSRVRLFRRPKIRLDSDVYLLIPALEPAPAASAQRFWLFDFSQAQNRAVKSARGGFAILRSRQLNVVESYVQSIFLDNIFRDPNRIPPAGSLIFSVRDLPRVEMLPQCSLDVFPSRGYASDSVFLPQAFSEKADETGTRG
jgi:hypothetical protein